MGQLTAVDLQNPCRFYRVNLFTTISKNLTFHVAFNKTVRASEVSGTSEAGEVSQPVQAS